MTDQARYETSFEKRLAAYAAIPVRPVDADAIAHATIAQGRSRAWGSRLHDGLLRRPLAPLGNVVAPRAVSIFLVVLLVLATLAGALYVGGRLLESRPAVVPQVPLVSPLPTGVAQVAEPCPAMQAALGPVAGATPPPVGPPVSGGADGPRNGVIAYVDTDGGISTWDPETGIVRRLVSLADPAARIGRLAWSPDGKRLALGVTLGPSDHPTCGDMLVVNADGSGLVDLTMLPAGEGADPMAWSPDGTRISYGHWTQTPNLYSVSTEIALADGSDRRSDEQRPLECNRGGGPRWSPDGLRVAFPDYGSGMACVYDSTTGAGTRLLPVGVTLPAHWYHDTLRWSLDGTQLLGFGQDADGVDWLYRVAVGSGAGERSRVASAGGGSAALSLDGTRYLIVVDRESNGQTTFDLALAGLNGTAPTTVATGVNPGADWSPDGTQVLYTDAIGLTVADIRGGNIRRLAGPPPGFIVWQPLVP